jgi:hypothetical protein
LVTPPAYRSPPARHVNHDRPAASNVAATRSNTGMMMANSIAATPQVDVTKLRQIPIGAA